MATKRVYVYKTPGLVDALQGLSPGDRRRPQRQVPARQHRRRPRRVPDDSRRSVRGRGREGRERIPDQSPNPAPKRPRPGIFGVEYEVKVNGKKAEGNSDPVIIIDL